MSEELTNYLKDLDIKVLEEVVVVLMVVVAEAVVGTVEVLVFIVLVVALDTSIQHLLRLIIHQIVC